jgi:hypothetical protein
MTDRETRVAPEWLDVLARLVSWGGLLVLLVAMSGHACGEGVLP